VKGRVDLRGRELQLRAVEIRELDVGAGGPAHPTRGVVIVDLAAASCTNALIAKLKDLFGAHPGSTPVLVRFNSSQGSTPIEVGSVRVDPAAGLLSELRLLLGPKAARLEDEPSPRPERAEVAPVG
jgi:DNA polymerase-3 subunit alpha